jgi:hypothetical protein
MKTPPEPSDRPSLETLLRLKRSERPDPDFWNEFDRGMKQKQLAAIVEPKPWWLECSLLARKFAPFAGLGLAGGAALFALVAVRTEMALRLSTEPVAEVAGRGSQASVSEADVAQVSASPTARVTGDIEANLPGSSTVLLASAESERKDRRATDAETNSIMQSLVGNFPESAASGIALLGVSPEMTTDPEVQAAAVPLASSAVSTEGQFASSMPEMDVLSHAAEAIDSSSAVADKEVVPVPFTNPRQARLLAMVADVDAAADSRSLAHVRDRVIHRMSEGESLYASISRLGVSGDRLSVKF